MNRYEIFANTVSTLLGLIRYNLKVIFGGRFIYFLSAALGIFILVTGMSLFNSDAQSTEGTVFWLLFVTGLLIIFYPVTFSIQTDVDCRMIEILFGIPNYRYKVWFVRLLLVFCITALILSFLCIVSSAALSYVPFFGMMTQIMIPIIALGCSAFLIATIVKSGSGSAVVTIIICMVFWLSRSFFNSHRTWDLFLNPFVLPEGINSIVWKSMVLTNRSYLVVTAIIALLAGLLNLQKRERFLR